LGDARVDGDMDNLRKRSSVGRFLYASNERKI
jgi:hypothetical protein